jgi:NitT/TauT family transport system permease protein
MKRLFIAIAFFALLVLAWHLLVRAEIWSPVLLPGPGAVGEYLWTSLLDGSLAASSWVTLKRLMIGYLIGCLAGLPLGMLTARSNTLNDTLGVLALGLQTLPSVCWVPLALICVDNGVRNLPPIYTRAARTMGSTGFHTLRHVILPASMPYVISGMKQGWAFAWRSLMAAEIYVTLLSGYGLGHLLHFGRELNAMEQVTGVMLVIVLIGLLADKILFSPWERFLHRRWGLNG